MKKQERLERSYGIIMPIFSLPSKYGIGTFGKAAYDFVDYLTEAGAKFWQILPLGQTSYGDSPYQSFSSFAGNPYFVDLDLLVEDGLLTKEDLENIDFGSDERSIDYARLYNVRYRVLEIAFENSKGKIDKEIKEFRKKEADWIEDYGLFMAIKRDNLDRSWDMWDEDLRDRKKSALNEFKKENQDLIDFYIFIQYEFFKQWQNLKDFTNRHQIEIIGDLPIYVAYDSCDAWVNNNILKLDKETKQPIVVGGAPPDGYSEDGQLWGNPVYRWDYMKDTENFAFWKKRIGMSLRLYDILRLDHFRGFEAYYAIPASDDTAKYGSWEKGEPYAFFDAIKEAFPDARFIAEDLGFITKEVVDLKDHYGFPGMNVIQFAFGDNFDSDYLPHNYEKNSLVYASTHDSDTLQGFIDSADEHLLELIKKYLGIENKEDIRDEINRVLMASVSDVAIYEIQDLFGLSNDSKINSPGTVGGNWVWRAVEEDFDEDIAKKFKDMSKIYGRN
uniref:4-alpha-glucanotransferase n=1 Tax=Anaerococcus mediterraneensis TaxID=1870984 RepID=UPI000930CB48|nr:4-alpha-glucanotransferase [Anaerococcus mediterraneensis]